MPRGTPFFFSSRAARPHLHSFPTRRSTDLSVTTASMPSEPISTDSRSSPGLSSASEPNRSEEHTSELQSHSDLVCRLLLEKKNRDPCKATNPGDQRADHVASRKTSQNHTAE